MRVASAVMSVLGESALWHDDSGKLLWLDLAKPALLALDVATGSTSRRSLAARGPLGGLVLHSDGSLALLGADGLRRCGLDGVVGEPLVDPLSDDVRQAYNDAGVDRAGRLWFGSCDVRELEPRGALYRLEGDQARREVAGLVVSNGPAFSPDGTTMYVSDSVAGTVLACSIDEHGVVVDTRTFVTFPEDEGIPDGLAVDSAGNVWVAHWGGGVVTQHDPSGGQMKAIPVPTPNVTSVAFGGFELRTLFITTAQYPYEAAQGAPGSGILYAVDVDVAGLLPAAWSGGRR